MKIKKQAFTLIEVLLGLIITAIIGLTIYNMFWSGMRLDDKMRRVFDNYIELLLANQIITHDLENAITLDFSGSYPDAIIFDGQTNEFAFITQTPKGIHHIRYYLGDQEGKSTSKSTIGRITNPSNSTESNTSLSKDYLWREDSSLSDWLNETKDNTQIQLIISNIKQGSFSCQYAPMTKDLHNEGSKGLDFTDSWDEKDLPLVVSCSFILSDSKNNKEDLMFKRDFFLAPVDKFHHEQQ